MSEPQKDMAAKVWYDELLQQLPSFVIPIVEMFFRWVGNLVETKIGAARADIKKENDVLRNELAQAKNELSQLRNEFAQIKKLQAESAQQLETKLNLRTAPLGVILDALTKAGTTLQQIPK